MFVVCLSFCHNSGAVFPYTASRYLWADADTAIGDRLKTSAWLVRAREKFSRQPHKYGGHIVEGPQQQQAADLVPRSGALHSNGLETMNRLCGWAPQLKLSE